MCFGALVCELPDQLENKEESPAVLLEEVEIVRMSEIVCKSIVGVYKYEIQTTKINSVSIYNCQIVTNQNFNNIVRSSMKYIFI